MTTAAIRPLLRTGVCLGLLLLLCARAASAASIASDGVYIRSSPSQQAKVLLVVPRGYPIEVLGHSGEWTRFRDWKNTTAWVASTLVSDVATAVILTNRANIRSAASGDAPVVTHGETGVIYKVLAKKDGWVHLGFYETDGPVGWIRDDLVFGE